MVMFNCFKKKNLKLELSIQKYKGLGKGGEKKKPLGVMPPVGEFQVRVHPGAAVESGSTAAPYFP